MIIKKYSLLKQLLVLLIGLLISADMFAQPVEVEPVDFNSSRDDFAPVVTQSNRKMFITSERSKKKQRIYLLEKKNSEWSSPSALDGDVNNSDQTGTVAITPDGQYIIFAATNHDVAGHGRTDLYSARKMKGEWTDIVNLGPNVNSPYWDSNPTLSSDGNTLFFASDRPGGQGGVDIWFCERTREGWTKAKNAGSSINTEYDEMTPYLSLDDKTFSFSSNRPGGQGGYDIYFAQRSSNTSFSSIKNAGSPINSEYDEYSYMSLQNMNVGYFSSNRPNKDGGELDIYTAVPNPNKGNPVVFASGVVTDAETDEIIPGCRIVITDLATKQKIATFYSDDETGEYNVVLQPGKKYSITATAPNYLFHSEKFEIPADDKGRNIEKDIKLSKSTAILLLFFDYDKAELKDESLPELDRVVEYLNTSSNTRIRLEGHTDDQGDAAYNKKLSLNRANAARDYLVKAGIDKKRIDTEGFGKEKPRMQGSTDEARTSNRRVEMFIIR